MNMKKSRCIVRATSTNIATTVETASKATIITSTTTTTTTTMYTQSQNSQRFDARLNVAINFIIIATVNVTFMIDDVRVSKDNLFATPETRTTTKRKMIKQILTARKKVVNLPSRSCSSRVTDKNLSHDSLNKRTKQQFIVIF